MNQVIFINLYRSGVYHRQGKPNATNLHGGDVYASEAAALENAEPDRGYITTVRAELPMATGMELVVNRYDSVPTPLSVTRTNNPEVLLPWVKPFPGSVLATDQSLDTADGDEWISGYREWRTRQALARA